MRSLGAQADDLLTRLSAAISALRAHVQTKDRGSLGHLEDRIDDLLSGYHVLLREIEPLPSRADYESFLRSMVSFCSVVMVLSARLGNGTNIAWGQHLFGKRDFKLADFDSLDQPLPDNAMKWILGDQAADLKGAFTELSNLSATRPHMRTRSVARDLDEICQQNGAVLTHVSLGFDLWDSSRIATELSITTAQVATMGAHRELIQVPSWGGQYLYPNYQTMMGQLRPDVVLVLQNTPATFNGWNLAIWMAENLGGSQDYYKNTLGGRGLWLPFWTEGPTGTFTNGLNHIPLFDTPAADSLYRVTHVDNSPFYFSSNPTTPQTPASAPQPAGRFDLQEASGKGSLYLAEQASGAWSETLDREPVVTLRELAKRVRWTLTPDESFDVGDLTGYLANLASHPVRADTQDVAAMVAASYRGMRVGLRTGQNGVGIILFGKSGPTLPHSAGLGLWSSARVEALQDDDLWTYLQSRANYHATFPIVLRRFPEEFIVN